jgi:hypothetical protein
MDDREFQALTANRRPQAYGTAVCAGSLWGTQFYEALSIRQKHRSGDTDRTFEIRVTASANSIAYSRRIPGSTGAAIARSGKFSRGAPQLDAWPASAHLAHKILSIGIPKGCGQLGGKLLNLGSGQRWKTLAARARQASLLRTKYLSRDCSKKRQESRIRFRLDNRSRCPARCCRAGTWQSARAA